MRSYYRSWATIWTRLKTKISLRSSAGPPSGHRALRMECLEARRVLATLTVNTSGDGATSSTIHDSFLTLREAVLVVNNGSTSGLGLSPAEQQQITGAPLGTDDTIEFNLGAAPDPITLTAGQLDIAVDLIIQGSTDVELTIDANSQSRIFFIQNNESHESAGDLKNVAISDLTLTNGLANDIQLGEYGGTIRSYENLTINDVRFLANNAAEGGAIHSAGGNVRIDQSLFEMNSGSAIFAINGYVFGVDVDVNHSDFLQNVSQAGTPHQSGGAIYAGGRNLNVANSTFTGNHALVAGGAVYSINCNLTITGSDFEDNYVTADSSGTFGGAVAVELNYSAVFRDSRFTSNHADGSVGLGAQSTPSSIAAE